MDTNHLTLPSRLMWVTLDVHWQFIYLGSMSQTIMACLCPSEVKHDRRVPVQLEIIGTLLSVCCPGKRRKFPHFTTVSPFFVPFKGCKCVSNTVGKDGGPLKRYNEQRRDQRTETERDGISSIRLFMFCADCWWRIKHLFMQAVCARVSMLSWLVMALSSITQMALFACLNMD